MRLTGEEIMRVIDNEIKMVENIYAKDMISAKEHLGNGFYCDSKWLDYIRDTGKLVADLKYIQTVICLEERLKNGAENDIDI